jgi:hypothetical protein
MKKSLALLLGLAFVFTAMPGYAADDAEETPLYEESLAQAKEFSDGGGGIEPKYVKGAGDDAAMQLYPWPTIVGQYTCRVAMPTCVEYPTCCWESFTSARQTSLVPATGVATRPSTGPPRVHRRPARQALPVSPASGHARHRQGVSRPPQCTAS